MNNWFKRNSTHFIIAAIFFVICFAYFTPAFQGKTLGQIDVVGAQSTQKEINDYRAKDTTILWTNQILSGMPAFQIWAPYPNNITTHVVSVLKAVFPNPVDTVLLLLAGSYFLFCVLKFNPWLAAAGAVAFTFSSYNIILLVAGHSNQAFAIAFFAPILASIILTLRGSYITGGALTALFLAMEIRANHIQMTYYLIFAIAILLGIELYHAIKGKATATFLKSMAYLGGGLLLALMVNASSLWSTYDYGKETIRGQSNLKQNVKEPSNGLEKEYAYQWSQGVGECLTFLIPNAYGGGNSGSEVLDENSDTYKALAAGNVPAEQISQVTQQVANAQGIGLYWGNKPGTFGPFYFGAVICFLFVFGLIIVKSRLKWWLLGTVIITLLLSFGGNWPLVSDIFFNYFPLYNKFRAVESIVAVTSICFPILALLAIQEVINTADKKIILKKLMLTLYIVGGIALIFVLIPDTILPFRPVDNQKAVATLTQAFRGDSGLANAVSAGIYKDRISLERADAFRTLIFVIIAFGIVWLFIKQKLSLTLFSLAFFGLILVDMWQVDKRYLKDASFADKVESPVSPRDVDTFIARDTDPDFRVFDTTQPITSDTYSPFFHKSIGGYSAARLKRYEELINNQLLANGIPNHDILDMLNAKYIITEDPKTQAASMQRNNTACGNAWFVRKIQFVKDADEEMHAIGSFAPKEEAMVDKQYASLIDEKTVGVDTGATIKLTHYNPDHMVYQSGSTVSQVAVFSEVYYNKGWKMYIDGVEKPYFRADYLLRAAQIPIGNHKIEFIFHPTSYYTGEGISLAGSILLVLVLGGAAYTENKKKTPAVAAKKA